MQELASSLNDRLAVTFLPVVFAAGVPKINPDPRKAPGSSSLLEVVNGIAFYALIASCAGFLLGAMMWAVGNRISNDYASSHGKTGMVIAAGAAFLTGAASAILTFAFSAGSKA